MLLHAILADGIGSRSVPSCGSALLMPTDRARWLRRQTLAAFQLSYLHTPCLIFLCLVVATELSVSIFKDGCRLGGSVTLLTTEMMCFSDRYFGHEACSLELMIQHYTLPRCFRYQHLLQNQWIYHASETKKVSSCTLAIAENNSAALFSREVPWQSLCARPSLHHRTLDWQR